MDGTGGNGGVRSGPAPWRERWQPIERLHEGDYSEAWAVLRADGADPTPRFLKALKRDVPDKMLARLHREATALAGFDHPRIPRLVEANTQHFGAAPGLELYLVTELVPGPTLARFDAGRLPLPLGTALDLASRLLDVIAHVHQRGRLHGDVNLENVILRGACPADPVLVDFNLLEAAGSVAGTIERRRHLDWRNDLRQVARVLFWALTGEYHVPLRDWHNRAPHRRTHEMRSIRALGGAARGALDELFDRAFALELHDRFQSVEELREAMGRVRATLSLGPGMAG